MFIDVHSWFKKVFSFLRSFAFKTVILNDGFPYDETTKLSPKYNQDGLVAAIAQDHQTGEILMLAWMNEEALQKTLETGQAHYFSRSRHALWHKGATSGAVQIVHDFRIDCDQDAVLVKVEQRGSGACHTGRRRCFYRKIDKDGETLHFDAE